MQAGGRTRTCERGKGREAAEVVSGRSSYPGLGLHRAAGVCDGQSASAHRGELTVIMQLVDGPRRLPV